MRVLCCGAMPKPSVAIIGPGRLGSALALALHAAGYNIHEIITRTADGQAKSLGRRVHAHLATIGAAELTADLVWLCVADSDIRSVADAVARRVQRTAPPRYAFHSSGALTSDELAPLQALGAATASVHPMMTFVRAAAPALAGVSFALEGDTRAVRLAQAIVRDLGGNVVKIGKEDKPLYHAWGAFSSPLLICELATADRIAAELGLDPATARKTLAPILRQTLENYLAHGPAAAFSGPLVRGDAATVRRHLQELSRVPGAREVYLALARSGAFSLPIGNREQIEKLIGEEATLTRQQRQSGQSRRSLGGIIQPY